MNYLSSIQTDINPFNIRETPTDLLIGEQPFLQDKEAADLWLAEVTQHIVDSLTEFEFTLDSLSRLIYLSPRQIRRKLKQLTGKTFSQYLKEARLQEAHRLLVQREVSTIKNLAYQVGLRDAKHFSKLFKAYYGDSPSRFLA